jgi:tetratricopeptide (TPR) repeat protein
MKVNKLLPLAINKQRAGNLKAAESLYKKILKKQPDNIDVLHMLGVIYSQFGNYDLAIKNIRKVLQLNPNNAQAYYNLGNIFRNKGRFDDAVSAYQKALKIDPNFTSAYYNLGIIWEEKREFDKAIECYQETLQLNPDMASAYCNLGNIFQKMFQYDRAIPYYEKALKINPRLIEAYMNIGNILQWKGQIDDAISCYRKSIEMDEKHADSHWNLGHALITKGDFKEGWKECEVWWQLEGRHHCGISKPMWDGSDIAGLTVLLKFFGGFGDTIQFCRYAPMMAQHGAKVIIECQKGLTSLLKSLEGVCEVIEEGDKIPEFDIFCPLMRLPIIFDTTPETIPSTVPYLSADPELVKNWRNKVQNDNSRLKVGLVWNAGPGFIAQIKSFPLRTYEPLFHLKDVTFYSIQKGELDKETRDTINDMGLIDYTEEIHDFGDAAALIENLDLIISVDTSVAHLAGALGKVVYTLIPFEPIWQWLLYREDSPWYPTMRLFRQPSHGDWESVIAEVSGALIKLLESN